MPFVFTCSFLSRTLTPASIRNYLNDIKLLHLLTGRGLPFHERVYSFPHFVRGIARNAFHTPCRPFPVIPFILVSFFDVLECNGDPRSSSLSVPFYLHFILSLVLLTSYLSLLNHFAPISPLVMWLLPLMVYLSHYSLQRRFNLEGVISTFLCLPLYPVSPYLRMIRLVPARRSCPGFLISGHKDLVPRTKRSFVSSFCPYLAAVRISNTQSFRGAA